MKQFFLFLLTTVSLVSCQEMNNNSAVYIPPNPQADSALVNDIKITDISMDWDNCINSSSNLSGTGDLLTGLIQDTQFRAILEKEYRLSVYTPDYTRTLQKDIQSWIDRFITRYICNIDTNIDIIAWVDYLKVISEYNSLNEKSKNNIGWPRVGSSDILLIRNSSQIIPVDSSVKIYNNTVTGGDVSHCKATKKYESVIWTCYLWLSQTESKESYQEYTIDIANGKVLNTRTYSKDI